MADAPKKTIEFLLWMVDGETCAICDKPIHIESAAIQTEVTVDEKAVRKYVHMRCARIAINRYTSILVEKRGRTK